MEERTSCSVDGGLMTDREGKDEPTPDLLAVTRATQARMTAIFDEFAVEIKEILKIKD